MSSTQQEYPRRAAVRTAAQVLVAVPAVLLTAAGVLTVIGQSDVLPPAWVAWAAAAAVTVSGLAALVARIMAVPGVDAWLRSIGLSSTPDPDVVEPPLPAGWESALRGQWPPVDTPDQDR